MNFFIDKILIGVLILGILIRIILTIFLPEPSFVDAIYHLIKSNETLKQKTLYLSGKNFMTPKGESAFLPSGMYNPPFYYLLYAYIFNLTNLPLQFPYIRIIPIIINFLQLTFAYLVIRDLLTKKFLQIFALATISINPMLVRYNAINYIEPFISVLTLGVLFFLIKYLSYKKMPFLICFLLFLIILGLSDRVGLILLLPFLFVLFCILRENPHKSLIFVLIIFVLIFVGSFYFLGTFVKDFSNLGYNLHIPTGYSFQKKLQFDFVDFFFDFWDFQLERASQYIKLFFLPIPLTYFMFFMIILPIIISFVIGIFNVFKSTSFMFLSILFVMFSNLTGVIIYGIKTGIGEARYLFPIVPLFLTTVVYGFSKIKKFYQYIIICSFLLYAIYSVFFLIGITIFYNNAFAKHAGIYKFIKNLPANSRIYADNWADISFYTGKESFRIAPPPTKNDLLEILCYGNYTHLSVGCFRVYIDQQIIIELEKEGVLFKLYEDSCGRVYKIIL